VSDLRCALKAWDFDKEPDGENQSRATVDLVVSLLVPHNTIEDRCGDHVCLARTAKISLHHYIRVVLIRCGFPNLSCAHERGTTPKLVVRPKHISPKPELPQWLQIPYIVVEEGHPDDDIIVLG
jgi:hypothetical protein